MQLNVLKAAPQTHTQAAASPSPRDAAALARELKNAIEGEVRFDDGSRALYATDASNYRQVPIGVVIPRTVEDVIAAVRICRDFDAPILSRGGGTSLAGQCCNVAVVIDHSKYLRQVLEIDAQRKLATVQTGCVLDDLNTRARTHGLIFGPDPATHNHCCIGGMLGNNSCGIHSLLAVEQGRGMRTADNTHALDIITYEGHRMTVSATPPATLDRIIRKGGPQGQIYRRLQQFIDHYGDAIRSGYPQLPRRVSGYNLDSLLPENGFHVARALVGSEGTLVTILHGTMHLVHNPRARSLLVLGYPDIFHAADHLETILQHQPCGLEGLDHLLLQWVKKKGSKTSNLKLMPPGTGFLMVEFSGDSKEDADHRAHLLMAQLKMERDAPSMKLFDDEEEEHKLWEVRESGLGATAWVPGVPDTWPGFEDSAVAPEHIAGYLRDLKALFQKYQYQVSLYGHFGQGCVHCRIPFDLYTAEGIAKYKSFMDEATDLVVSYRGSFSGEHGDGQARAEFLPKMYGPDLMQAMRDFKSIWDPQWKMNPGKVIDPYSITDNLRLGVNYDPPEPKTHFQFPDDHHSFSRAALRCVGVGTCRREENGIMCPSYMVTHEEKHSTRGRARLLWEMLNGEVADQGWKSDAVHDALHLCLACKGCKHECPVSVDMATYKAEFYSHYYEGRIHPRHDYAFGWIGIWAQLAGKIPTLVNFATQTPGVRDIAKKLAGMAPQRRVPRFAPQSFQDWFSRRKPRNFGRQPVMIWPDTFNNYFHPEVAKAAVDVLEHAGFQVVVPQQSFCCGRPLYDYGFLNMAKRWLVQIMNGLSEEIEQGMPIVVLEPSCCAVFKDELVNLWPNSEQAKRLHNQTYMLSDFLESWAPDYHVPKLRRKALVHGHCHHHSVLRLDAEQSLLKKMGLDFTMLDSGCCGMAGAFGFEDGDRYDVSMKCGERVLLPAVRDAPDDTIILTDGFSCREQIVQGTHREPLHLAQAIQLALREGPRGPATTKPEDSIVRTRNAEHRRANVKTAALIGVSAAVAAAGIYAWQTAGRKDRTPHEGLTPQRRTRRASPSRVNRTRIPT